MSNVVNFKATATSTSASRGEQRIVFTNSGVLDINLVKLLGVSVKETESPIGFFGTGLKYAMAATLRLGGTMKIITGGQIFDITGEAITLRGKEFTQVCINGEPIGFTTELGKQWLPWMVVRELYSNTLDEKGEITISEVADDDIFTEGRTAVILGGDCFLEVWNDRGNYFLDTENEKPVHTSEFVDAYASHGLHQAVFYRGIKIWDSPKPTLFRYNLKSKVMLTEDRTLMYAFQFHEAVEKSLIASLDDKYIAAALTAGDTYTEGARLDFSDSHSSVKPSDAFIATCASIAETSPPERNKNALRWCNAKTQTLAPLQPVTLTHIEAEQLQRCIDFLRKLGYGYELDRYKIEVVKWLGQSIYGQAVEGTAFIAQQAFEKGTKFLCSTLLEELVHLQYGFNDETREMQTWLFDRIVTMGEELVAKEAL